MFKKEDIQNIKNFNKYLFNNNGLEIIKTYGTYDNADKEILRYFYNNKNVEISFNSRKTKVSDVIINDKIHTKLLVNWYNVLPNPNNSNKTILDFNYINYLDKNNDENTEELSKYIEGNIDKYVDNVKNPFTNKMYNETFIFNRDGEKQNYADYLKEENKKDKPFFRLLANDCLTQIHIYMIFKYMDLYDSLNKS